MWLLERWACQLHTTWLGGEGGRGKLHWVPEQTHPCALL